MSYVSSSTTHLYSFPSATKAQRKSAGDDGKGPFLLSIVPCALNFFPEKDPVLVKSHCFVPFRFGFLWVYLGVRTCAHFLFSYFFFFFFVPFVFLGSIAFNTLPVSFVLRHLWVTGSMSRFCSSMIHFN